MARYALSDTTMSIYGPDGSVAINVDIPGHDSEERLAIATFMRDLANGVEAEIPPSVAYHWAFFGKPIVDPGRIYAKAPPANLDREANVRSWNLLAEAPDAELAMRLCNAVNRRIGWDVAGDVHRNIMDSKPLVVKPDGNGRWIATVSGQEASIRFDDAAAAKRYAISTALPDHPDSRDASLRKDVRDFEVGLTFRRDGEPGLWQVTDIGRRTMQAIKLDGLHTIAGPPYEGEECLDEKEIAYCRYADGDDEENEFRLCFVMEDEVAGNKIAYFATGDFNDLETEGWRSFSRQSNATAPYPARNGEYELRTVTWTEGDLEVEPEGESANHLNRFREKPWLVAPDGRRVFSGMPLGPFRQVLSLTGCVVSPGSPEDSPLETIASGSP